MIDVTRRSVEETAAAVINILSGGRGQVEVLRLTTVVLASTSASRGAAAAPGRRGVRGGRPGRGRGRREGSPPGRDCAPEVAEPWPSLRR